MAANDREWIRRTLQYVFACSAAFCSLSSLAATYPEKTIRLVVGTPPGDSPDTSARLFAAALSSQMGQTVLVDNRPGASHTIAFNLVAKSQPDGYTVGWGTFLLATSPLLVQNLPYDPVKDLQMIMQAVYTPNLLAVTPSLPVKSVSELIAHAKQNPGRLSFASAGNASSLHLGMELFKLMTGTHMMHVPYKGSQLAIADVISGQVQVICDNIASVVPHVQANRLRGLGVSTEKPSGALPGIPTIGETVKGYDVVLWYGVFGPKGLPKDIVDLWNKGIAQALQAKELQDRMAAEGLEPAGGPPEQFRAVIKRDVEKWKRVVKEAKITLQS